MKTKSTFPVTCKKLSLEEIAGILHRALAASKRFASIAELARELGIPRQTLNHYFFGRVRPSEEKWVCLRNALVDQSAHNDHFQRKSKPTKAAVKQATQLKADLEGIRKILLYFRDVDPSDRKNLRETIPGREIGYLAGLMTALYDEDQLAAWLVFSKDEAEDSK